MVSDLGDLDSGESVALINTDTFEVDLNGIKHTYYGNQSYILMELNLLS